MRILSAIRNKKNGIRLAMMVAGLLAVGPMLLLSASSAHGTSLTLVNNSAKEISHLYLSPVDNDLWGPDQLNGSSISPGATRTINVSWEQSTVKLVAEDQDGCFLSTTVEASDNAVWTIAVDAVRNCGD
jgi:hypothetical protein